MTSQFQHSSLAQGRWQTLSLAEQLGNIGSEVHRVVRAQEDKKQFKLAVLRAIELLDLTIADKRWRGRLKELTRVRSLFCDATLGINEYNVSLEELDRYFFHFAYAARARR